MKKLKETLESINKLDCESMKKAKLRLDNLTKPVGSLGRLEEIAIKLAGITGNSIPQVKNKAHIVMVGDHGVVEEGVSAYPQEVTSLMVKNFINKGAAINVFTSQQGVDLILVDIGMKDKIESETVLQYKVRAGTGNFARELAMSVEEAAKALEVGMIVTEQLIENDVDLISTGEMGIGNTTSSSAILAVLSNSPLEDIVGSGTGLVTEKISYKRKIIKEALELHKPDPDDALDILSKVGGLEIAGMAGCMLAAAANKKPVIVDGFISGAAALIAQKLNPLVVEYILPSHISAEPGHIKMYELLGLKPFLDLDMRLGEGTGALLAVNIIEASCNMLQKMATFAEAGIKRG
ncbi:MAG: nicotinate-nucleotide--dimethylbenzimidazole phosphoribosyltransferase [Halanaerobiales bacterium]